MGKRATPGLRKRNGIWHIQKQIKGYGRLHESTGSTDLEEAERYLAHRLEQIRRTVIYGERPEVTFRQAAERYMHEHAHLKSLERAGYAFDAVMPYIGDLPLERVHDGALAPYRTDRVNAGCSAGTINRDLSCVRRVLNLAARQWRHPNGMTYLETPPLISMAKGGKRAPYPVTWEQQALLFAQLPAHLERMALFMVNTGLREGELCSLQWSWLQEVPELETSVFVLPDTKNGQPRVVVLNRIARGVLESIRGQHPEYVFSYRGAPHSRMNNSAWRKARARAGLPQVRVHDLRHTFGHRLRAAGVSFEDRQDLIGHKSERMTTHYSAPELSQLVRSAELLCEQRPATILRVVGK
jgi:integrase